MEKKADLQITLGDVRAMARVRLNGQDLGVVWCAPWTVALGAAVKEKGNELEIDVANLWPNRLIGDAGLDWASYVNSASAVTVTLGHTGAQTGASGASPVRPGPAVLRGQMLRPCRPAGQDSASRKNRGPPCPIRRSR